MPDFTVDNVAANAALPASASVTPTSKSVTQHSLRDQLEVADRAAANAAANKSHRGIRFSKIVPGGPTS